MNQTRTFLIFAWLVVATLLFMAWEGDKAPKAPGDTAAALLTSPRGADLAHAPSDPSKGDWPLVVGRAARRRQARIGAYQGRARPAVAIRTDR